MTTRSERTRLADAILEDSFEDFAVRLLLELELDLGGDDEWEPPWHVSKICDDLQRVVRQPGAHYALAAPPRSLKSRIGCIALALWYWLHNPSDHIIMSSYGTELLDEHMLAVRRIMDTRWYQRLGPAITASSERNRLQHIVNNHGGSIRTVTRGGAVTGLGADLIIVDDSIKAVEADSPTMRQNAVDFFNGSLYSRLNSKAEGRVVVIQQRLHEEDLIGHLADIGTYEICELKAIAPKRETYKLSDGRKVGRKRGQALCPAHEDIETLNQIRRQIGAARFEAQYQQSPTPPDGGRVRPDWFDRHDKAPEREELEWIIVSVDTGATPFPESDYSVFIVAGYQAGTWHILEIVREQLDFPDLRDRALEIYQRWRVDWMVIESAGSGISLIQELRRSDKVGRGKVRSHRPDNDKVTRMATSAVQLRDGGYSLPDSAPWLDAFEQELRAFPGGRYDDQVDALSQLLVWTSPERMQLLGSINPETGRRRSIRRPSSRRGASRHPRSAA